MVRRVVATIGVGLLFAGPSSMALAAPVTVQLASDMLDPTTAGSLDDIETGLLIVRESRTIDYTPFSDYAVDIPPMNADTYSAVLDYVASTL